MHRIFQAFLDHMAESADDSDLRAAMAEAAAALELPCFAYLSLQDRAEGGVQLLSTYPSEWTTHYRQSGYERVDPVVAQALRDPEPFEWGGGLGTPACLSRQQQQLFDEAAAFGIRYGFTVPIHDGGGLAAAVTFAAGQRKPVFCRSIAVHGEVLQLMAMYFHVHVRHKLAPDRSVAGVALSPREFECLEWAARGKSALDTGTILGISRRTVVFHLESAKAKLGVRSICQAVARFSASRPSMR